MQLAFNAHIPRQGSAVIPDDDNADTTNRLERTIHLSAAQVAFRFPPSGRKAME